MIAIDHGGGVEGGEGCRLALLIVVIALWFVATRLTSAVTCDLSGDLTDVQFGRYRVVVSVELLLCV